MTDADTNSIEKPPESGPTYRIITRYWPRIAAGLVVTLGLFEFLVGGLTADSGIEFYLMAWAATTGGLWFLSERAESALSDESRFRAVQWLQESDYRTALMSMPSQFAMMFDRAFGERHWSLSCFLRSCVASVSFVAISYAVCRSLGLGLSPTRTYSSASDLATGILISALIFNVIPDFFSLLETRWLLGIAQRRLRIRWILASDALITLAIFVVSAFAVAMVLTFVFFQGTGYEDQSDAYWAGRALGDITADPTLPIAIVASTFFTSVWLWLYALSVPFSRFLIRLNSGVGFLLKVTDVEKQPFRSMGFTSVVIVSVLFLLGLPFVLLS